MELTNDSLRSGSRSRRRKILIAEDSEIDRGILRELLRCEYDIMEAADGNEAYAILKNKYRELSAVILDLVMPQCDGYQFMEMVRDDPLLSTVPIIVLTGGHSKNMEEYCLKCGASDFLTKPYSPSLIRARLQNIIRMREMTSSLNAIEFDDLTGIYTKQAFFYHARTMLDENPNVSFEVVISDIENFRLINATYGPNMGNELLKFFAMHSLDCCRNGLCGRYGGDQIVIMRPVASAEEVAGFQQKYREFKRTAPVPNIVLKYGIYQNIDRALPLSVICDRAFLALKSVKHNHNLVSARYDGPLSQRHLKEQIYEQQFQSALQNREFVVWYQPKYDANRQNIVGAEALVRWNTPNGLLPPGEFMGVFESNGLVRQLDEYVFRTVCQFQKAQKRNGYLMPISVNLSRNSLYNLSIVHRYQQIVRECGIDPKDVPIELTETAAVENRTIKAFTDAFFEAGFPLHMDDFGSGRSSLSGLNLLHFDMVKLDKSLIDYIGDRRGELILKYTMVLSKELGLQLVAEGVETAQQLEFLQKNGCDFIQGYYFSRPLPVEEFEKVVISQMNATSRSSGPQEKYTLISEEELAKHSISKMNQYVPGGFFGYRADEEARILFSNRYMWNLFGCDSEDEFMEYVHGSFRGVVCPEELEKVQQSIDQQISSSSDQMDFVKYHIVRKDGVRIPVMDYGHLVLQGSEKIFYVFVVAEE